MFKKILVANRGEIAVRVIRACREMGIRTVAVYSKADRSGLHVQMADEAIAIGPSPPLESYLHMEKIIEAARTTGAEAIHPGYGFLAENHRFATACDEAGIVIIGPNAEAMRLVGDKVASRKTLSKIGVPIIPGMKSTGKSVAPFLREAEKIGYPVMIKASAGGGGKGMRVVRDPKDLERSVEAGMREAQSAFGDASVYLEKCIERPRHVEFQVLADRYGKAIHLFERECSIQRRHQKIVEETPSTVLDSELRRRMGEAAVEVVRATGYTNAGTVEFLLDEDRNFYFLEVNARIQVEHPITEMVAGVDLVKWQIRIAAGEPLDLSQEHLHQCGHAIECRIYAEEPANHFLPSLGKVLFLKNPEGPGIRVDSGIYSGCEVSMYYDPILAKLIAWGEDRECARKRMTEALSEYVVLGIKTTIPYLKHVMEHPAFVRGDTTTDFIEKNCSEWKAPESDEAFRIALVAAAVQTRMEENRGMPMKKRTAASPWTTVGRWRIGER
ncbi:MAG: acetyl-CoA carboxylase biotin carboxylase subunit [bacterium]